MNSKEQIKKLLNNYHLELSESLLHAYIHDIYRNSKDEILKALIKFVVIRNDDYKSFIKKQYISESTYFRLKNHLIDKIYHLMILDKKVDRDEILSEF